MTPQNNPVSQHTEGTPDDAEKLESILIALNNAAYRLGQGHGDKTQHELTLIAMEQVEALLDDARKDELNKFMDVNAHTVTDTQGTYIARRYQQLHEQSLKLTPPANATRDEDGHLQTPPANGEKDTP